MQPWPNCPAAHVRPTYGNSRDNWYGLNNRDYEKEKSDLFTASVTHKFTDTNKIRNSLRYSKTKQDYVWTQPDDSKGNASMAMSGAVATTASMTPPRCRT
jgi:outer membrane receptor for monomeric catechols